VHKQAFYSDTSQVLRIIDDNGHERLRLYDTVNRLLRITDPKGNSATYRRQ
jgi:uncharacterized protein RhaS with RHS repeats